jgi:predicted metalloprotease
MDATARNTKIDRIGRTYGRAVTKVAMLLLAGLLAVACAKGGDSEDDGRNPLKPSADLDGDGILDSVDGCPSQAENRNGVFDRDGCPDRPADLYHSAMADAQTFWANYFNGVLGRPYYPARLVMFSTPIVTPCGPASPGPFYCGLDATVYLHEGFMDDQLRRFGDFAPVVIVAHEVGHHTQNLTGVLGAISIQKELQADCLAGAWSASAGARGMVETGDLNEGAMSLFSAGDAIGTPWFAPGAHGNSVQRQQAFFSGFSRGAFGC